MVWLHLRISIKTSSIHVLKVAETLFHSHRQRRFPNFTSSRLLLMNLFLPFFNFLFQLSSVSNSDGLMSCWFTLDDLFSVSANLSNQGPNNIVGLTCSLNSTISLLAFLSMSQIICFKQPIAQTQAPSHDAFTVNSIITTFTQQVPFTHSSTFDTFSRLT